MTRIRLLPLVLIAISALLAVKILGLATGAGSFAIGPRAAVASGAGEGGEAGGSEEGAPAPGEAAANQLMAPVDLSSEYRLLQQQQAEEASKAAGEHGAAHDGAGAHGAADKPSAGKPPEGKPSEGQAAAPAAEGHGAPAAEGHGEGGGHGAPAAAGAGVYVQRPSEYAPPINSSEQAILDGLSARRTELDKREQEINLRLKLLQAAEQRISQRVGDLKSIESQLGDAATRKEADSRTSEQMAALVSLYETMKPKAAAAVFGALDMPVLLSITRRMNPRKLSPIIAAMAPERASTLTAAMASVDKAKRIIVTTEAASPTLPAPAGATDPADLPQIMPAPALP